MQIVINIPNEEVPNNQEIIDISLHFIAGEVCECSYPYIVLPKGHRRIMDVDKIIKKMEEREERLKDDRSIWETAGVKTAIDVFGETIIEADEGDVK